MIIHHLTLMTGDCVTHRLDTLDAGAVAACRALLPDGGLVPSFPAYRVEIHQSIFTLWRGREPVVTCGVGNSDDPPWYDLCGLQKRFAPCKITSPPQNGPWLACVLLPGLLTMPQHDIAWLADFERCMASAILLPSA